MNRSTPGLPVHHQLPKFTQTHVHWVGDAIQPTHPLLSRSPSSPSPRNDITYIHIPALWLNTHCSWRIYLTSLWQKWLVAICYCLNVCVHHQLNGHEFEQTPGVSEGQGSLAGCSSLDRKGQTWLSDRTTNIILGRKHVLNFKRTS